MKNNQKGIIQILLVLGIVVALGIIGYEVYLQKKSSTGTSSVPSAYQTQYTQSGQSVAPVKNTADLNSASSNLDSSDTTQIDSQLNALNTASSGF